MDIFDIHNVKAEKANAMLRYHQFRTFAKLFRFVELFLAVILISWITFRLPLVIGMLFEYFRLLVSVIVSPLFIFLIGNVIVLTLVIKSGQLAGEDSESNAGNDIYNEIVSNEEADVVPPVLLQPDEIVYQDKQIISEVKKIYINNKINNDTDNDIKSVTEFCYKKPVVNSDPDLDPRVYRRSQSEILMMMKKDCNEASGKLKRSETEIRRTENEIKENDVVEELSNEEFQKKIEGFIAKQVRFHQEEKLAIVVP
uniref:uncharacterized protein LOC122590231 n=1 Tax=Erigeron canadensis TaxID=72917 RepID=UPI001CB941D3|nr:uncharacterized protein LOC122590231 [Erigeron canadensis]